uniref:Uncharacterized protein n=1 Tax=Anguilla anguilla TaxID=7936 RepID=A0A0E9V7F9_ANGAN
MKATHKTPENKSDFKTMVCDKINMDILIKQPCYESQTLCINAQ